MAIRAREAKPGLPGSRGWEFCSYGEDETFLREGGMINLVRDRGSDRSEVNADALDGSEIHFSAKILALAKSDYGVSPATASNSPGANSSGGNSPRNEARQVQRRVLPEYPEIAAQMNLKGTALVEARVRPDGTVQTVRVLGGHPILALVPGKRGQALEVSGRVQGNGGSGKVQFWPAVKFATERKRASVHTSAAIPVSQTANAIRTTQPGATPTRFSRNGRKFHVVMWT
jgi:hypothetical protein